MFHEIPCEGNQYITSIWNKIFVKQMQKASIRYLKKQTKKKNSIIRKYLNLKTGKRSEQAP